MLFSTTAANPKDLVLKPNTSIKGSKPDIKIDLDNDQVREKLAKKYDKYDDILEAHESISHLWSYFYSITQDRFFSSNNYYQERDVCLVAKNDRRSPFYNRAEAYEWASKAIGKPTSYYKTNADGTCEIRYMLPPIIFAKKLYANADPDILKKFEKIIQDFIPNFHLPTSWKQTDHNNGKRLLLDVAPIESPRSSLLLFEKKMIQFEAPEKFDGPYEADEFYKKSTPDLLEVSFLPNVEECYFKPDYNDMPDYTVDSGTTHGRTGTFIVELIPIVYWVYPQEYALYASDSNNFSDFIPKNFVNRLNIAMSSVSNNITDYPAVIGNFKRVKTNNIKKEKAGILAKKRVNEDNLTILKSNTICFVDNTLDNIDIYNSMLNAAYDPITNSVAQNKDIPGLRNLPIYADWYNNKLVYANVEGRINTIDLAGCIPLDKITIYRRLFQPLDSKYMKEFFTICHKYAKQFGLYDPVKMSKDFKFNSLLSMVDFLASKSQAMLEKEVFVKDIYNENFISPLVRENSRISDEDVNTMYQMLKEIGRICLALAPRVSDFSESYASKITFLIPNFIFINKYAKDLDSYKEHYKIEVEKNTIRLPANEKFVVPNAPGLTSFMPHQASAVTELSTEPQYALIDVNPGGGKTIMSLSDIFILLAKGKIKRPLYLCPGNLAKEVFKECVAIGQGKINPFVIRQSTVDHMMSDNSHNFDYQGLVKYIKSCPINTVFITTYEFLRGKRDLTTGKNTTHVPYGETTIRYWPNVEFINQCDFDYIIIDESHRTKNLDSSQSKASAMVRANCSIVRQASGTIISDNASDLVGQTGIFNAAILGDKQQFIDNFTSGGTTIQLAEGAADKILKTMNPYLRKITKKNREWAFLLPKPFEQFYDCHLTENQAKFYVNILNEAIEEITKELGPLAKKGDDTDEEAALIEEAMKKHLSKVEQFLGAPGANEAFANLVSTKPIDLISPLVPKTNSIIKAHFQGGNDLLKIKQDTGKSNKIIVVAYHTSVGDHMFDNLDPAFKKHAVRFRAGDEQAIVRFREDPNIWILIGSENAMKEGLNLQIASRLIRLESLWSPGPQEQTMARIFRPDPRGQHARDSINVDWLIISNTMSVAKCARLLSKTIDKAKIDESDNPEWKKIGDSFDQLELIRMNLDTIQQYSSFDSLNEHFENYSRYRNWQDEQFDTAKRRLKESLERKYGRKIEDSEVAKLAMVPVDGKSELPGSKTTYVPFIPGVNIHDEHNLGLTPIATLEFDNDNESDDDQEENTVATAGQYVMTEFGAGRILKTSKNSVTVRVAGFKDVKLSKTVVFATTTPEGETKLKSIIKGNPMSKKLLDDRTFNKSKETKVVVIPKGKPEKKPMVDFRKVAPSINKLLPKKVEEVKKPIKIDKKKVKPDLELNVSTINDQPSLYVYADESDTSYILKHFDGWREVPDFYAFHVKNYQGLMKLMEKISKQFAVNTSKLNDIMTLAGKLKTGKGKLQQSAPLNLAAVKNFFRIQHRQIPTAKSGQRQEVRPWILIWDTEVYICFNIHTHPAKVINVLKRLKGSIPNVHGDEYDGAVTKFFKNKKDALKDMEKLEEYYNISNKKDTINEINTLKLFLKSKSQS